MDADIAYNADCTCGYTTYTVPAISTITAASDPFQIENDVLSVFNIMNNLLQPYTHSSVGNSAQQAFTSSITNPFEDQAVNTTAENNAISPASKVASINGLNRSLENLLQCRTYSNVVYSDQQTIPSSPTDPFQVYVSAENDVISTSKVASTDEVNKSLENTCSNIVNSDPQSFLSSAIDPFQDYAVYATPENAGKSISYVTDIDELNKIPDSLLQFGTYYDQNSVANESLSPVEILYKEMNLEPKDEKIFHAVGESIKTGSLTPLVKEELKYSIQTRRLKEGKDELQVSFSEPEKPQMTGDDVVRAEKRRLQGRVAAQNFRLRQKQKIEDLQRKCNSIESQNTQLRDQMRKLKQLNEQLKSYLNDHLKSCSRVSQGIFKPPRWC